MARSMTSEWDRCQHENLPQIPRVPYHMTFGSGLPGTSGQKRAIPDASPADLQDSLSPIFQLAPGQMSTGNFCALLQPGHGSLQPPSPTQYTRAVEEGEEALHCQHPFPPQNNQGESKGWVPCSIVLGLSQVFLKGILKLKLSTHRKFLNHSPTLTLRNWWHESSSVGPGPRMNSTFLYGKGPRPSSESACLCLTISF